MYTFNVWIRINDYQTTHVRLQASNHLDAKMIAEAQYGQGKVINVTLAD